MKEHKHNNNKTRRLVIKNKEDYNAAIYFILKDNRSDRKYIKSGENSLVVHESVECLLKDINIPFNSYDSTYDLH